MGDKMTDEQVVARCAAETLAALTGDSIDVLGGKLWFLQRWAEVNRPELADHFGRAAEAASLLREDGPVVAAVRDLAVTLPIEGMD